MHDEKEGVDRVSFKLRREFVGGEKNRFSVPICYDDQVEGSTGKNDSTPRMFSLLQ